ncbi:MAG: CvpA family protein [Bacteroides sp.]|nr:CvpA family protein [Roseburia sp.]MCM1346140.1 CvpA family protein [Bacteroides sp.]MCM1421219.1 CvpA family protein [Bacteroides sp.]
MEILIVIVLLVGAGIGFYQGAFKQIANFVGVVAGIVLACVLYDNFGDYLSVKTGASEGIGHTVAFLLIAVLTPIVFGWVATLFTKLFNGLHLGCLNRLAGAVVGVVCYGLLMSFAFNVMDFVTSSAGMKPEKLDGRPALFYKVKHAAQIFVPDFIIVTDAVEEQNGCIPKHGIKGCLPSVLGGEKE